MLGKVKSLRELFGIQLCYAYDCEKKLVEKGLPEMIENATSRELRSALEQHLQETRTHITRLERVFSSIGMAPDTKTNDIFDKMASAAKDSKANIDQSPLRDAALIVNGTEIIAPTGQSARTVDGPARGRAVRSQQPLVLHVYVVAE